MEIECTKGNIEILKKIPPRSIAITLRRLMTIGFVPFVRTSDVCPLIDAPIPIRKKMTELPEG